VCDELAGLFPRVPLVFWGSSSSIIQHLTVLRFVPSRFLYSKYLLFGWFETKAFNNALA
jgi:hypothetical protein